MANWPHMNSHYARGSQFPGRGITTGMPKTPIDVTSTFFNTFASERPQVWTRGRQTCFLPWALLSKNLRNWNAKVSNIVDDTTRRHEALEGLNSSLAQSAAQLWLVKLCPERENYTFSEKFWILLKTRFFSHNFGSRYASKSFKGSIDADFRLVYNKTLSQGNGSMDWGPGSGKGGQKCEKLPSLWRHLQKTPNPKRKAFFSISTRRLAESVEGLNSSLALAAGQVIGLQSFSKKVAHAGLKRSQVAYLQNVTLFA